MASVTKLTGLLAPMVKASLKGVSCTRPVEGGEQVVSNDLLAEDLAAIVMNAVDAPTEESLRRHLEELPTRVAQAKERHNATGAAPIWARTTEAMRTMAETAWRLTQAE